MNAVLTGLSLVCFALQLAEEEFKKAEAKYKEAFGFNSNYFDGLCAMGQLEFERAKVKAKLSVKPTP